jgi:2-C-methyl-D-erythritol 4-phosphate cytidylyltransferase
MTPGRTGVVVVAAGSGSRFGVEGPAKQYRPLLGVPILEWAIRPFLDHPAVIRTVVVLPPDDASRPPEWLARHPVIPVAGGARRSDSVRAGLDALGPGCDRVLVHDGARPFVDRALIDQLLAAGDGAVIPGVPLTDTVKEVGPDGMVRATLERSRLWTVQTPQLFPLETLRDIHQQALAQSVSTSDDAALFEWRGLPVRLIPGPARNIKVTTSVDLALAEVLARGLPVAGGPEIAPDAAM